MMHSTGYAYLLNHSHTMTPFDGSGKEPFENIVGKEEIACTSNIFYSIKGSNDHFCHI